MFDYNIFMNYALPGTDQGEQAIWRFLGTGLPGWLACAAMTEERMINRCTGKQLEGRDSIDIIYYIL